MSDTSLKTPLNDKKSFNTSSTSPKTGLPRLVAGEHLEASTHKKRYLLLHSDEKNKYRTWLYVYLFSRGAFFFSNGGSILGQRNHTSTMDLHVVAKVATAMGGDQMQVNEAHSHI